MSHVAVCNGHSRRGARHLQPAAGCPIAMTEVTTEWPADCSCWPATGVADRKRRKAPVALLAVLFVSCLLWSSCRCDQVPDGHQIQDLVVDTAGQETPGESTGERSFRSRRHCPSCQLTGNEQHQQHRPVEQQQAAGDSARLESIKRQILVKLGLNAKPNLLSTMPPRDFILETLLRAEESTVAAAPARPSDSKDHHHHSSADAVENSVEDDFYGKTSEIIAFGEPGDYFGLGTTAGHRFPYDSKIADNKVKGG